MTTSSMPSATPPLSLVVHAHADDGVLTVMSTLPPLAIDP